MMYKILGIICLAVSAGCTVPIHTKTNDGTLRVWSDGGGLLDKRMDEIAQLREDGTRVEIVGPCGSVCPMYLSLDNTYVQEDVIFGFHGTSHWTGLPLANKDGYDALLALHLPGPIRDVFWNEWRHMRLATHQVTAKELKKLAPDHIKLMK